MSQASNLYGDEEQNKRHAVKKMVKTNQFAHVRSKFSQGNSRKESSRNNEQRTKRSRVEENGELLQPESLLEEIKREVSEYSQS